MRIEELINYFPYEYEKPTAQHPFAVQSDVALALDLASGALGSDPGGYRTDFVKLVTSYASLPVARTSSDRR